MPEKADVRSLDVLGEMRRAVVVFKEEAKQSLAIAASEIQHTIDWIEHDRLPFWKHEINRRDQALVKAKLDLQQAELQKRFGKVSTVDERKEVRRRQEALHEARQKVESCQKTLRVLEKEQTTYYGGVQGMARLLEVDLPRAAHRLQRMGDVLAEYAQGGERARAGLMQQMRERAEDRATGGAARPGGGVGDARSTLNKLRQRVPRDASRLAVKQESRARVELLERELNSAHADRVVLFAEEEDRPTRQQTVLVESGADEAETIALVRVAASDAEDSGWTVVVLDGHAPGGRFVRVPIARVIDPESALFAALGVDQGWGLLLDGAGEGYELRTDVRGVFDQRDHVVWGTLARDGSEMDEGAGRGVSR